MTENNKKKTSAERDEATRLRKERIAAATKSVKSEKKRGKIPTWAFTVLVGLVGIGIIATAAVTAMNNKVELEKTIIAPANITKDFGVVYKAEDEGGVTKDGAVEVVLYEDFSCPHCKEFETANSRFLKNMVKEGKITLEYRTVNFMDRGEVGDSATAANAAYCARDAGGNSAFVEMHDKIYSDKVTINKTDLLTTAREIAEDTTRECVMSNRYGPWMQNEATKKFVNNKKLNGTPSVLINGELVSSKDMFLVQSIITEKTLELETPSDKDAAPAAE